MIINVGFEILTAVSVKSTAYWVVTPYNSGPATFQRKIFHLYSESESEINKRPTKI
jgi:hypothetical protein